MLKTVIFDFDGVIVDSNKIKREAYDKIFCSFKGAKRVINAVVREFEPSTREIMITEIARRLSAGSRKKLVQEYADICEKEVVGAREVKGALRSLMILSEKYNLYINSMTPAGSLERIIRKRGLKKYFKGIYGAPGSKEQNLRKIIIKEKVASGQMVFIGDNVNDCRAARKTKVNFVGISNNTNEFWKMRLKYKLRNCTKLCEIIGKIENEMPKI